MPQIERAIELDPFAPMPQNHLGWVLYLARRYDDAVARFQDLLRREPNWAPALGGLGNVYHVKGMYDEWLAAQQSYFSMIGLPQAEEALALGYAEGGHRAAARHLGDTLATLHCGREQPSPRLAGAGLRGA
jgi:tetratricopeptide (TPR) repeat protein